jgi:hypothetical protein
MIDENENESEYLLNHPEELDILEEAIDFQTQKDYIEYSDTFDRGELTEEETINLSNMLYNTKMPLEGKKKGLTLLAHLGSVTAFRQIEKYYKSPDNELKQWSALALQECKMFMENDLTDRMTGFVSGGLGGSKNRLRFYFLVLPLEDQLFTETQKHVIQEEFNLVAKKYRSLVESFDLSDTYVGFTVLMPMDIALDTFIGSGIKKCNELGTFVFEFYYATNQGIPGKTEIEEIIRIVRSD